MTLVFVYLIAQTTYFISILDAQKHVDTLIVVYTFVFAFIVDQLKQFVTNFLIYMVVVKRFGFLKENEKEFINRENTAKNTENGVINVQNSFMKVLESSFIEICSMINIALYTVFILTDLTAADTFRFNPNVIAKIDRVFLWIFAIEILCKTFASNGTYLIDKFNMFDATIVFISVILNQKGVQAKGLGVLRLLRVVVITIRKITGNQSKLRHQSKNKNPLESVIQILN